MRKQIVAAAMALGAAGCAPMAHETIAMTCTEYVGRPISERIAAYGPPKTVIRLSPTTVGYVFEAMETRISGGDPYYTVNYMTGVDRHRTPYYRTKKTCRGTFVVHAPADAIPVNQRIIVDVY